MFKKIFGDGHSAPAPESADAVVADSEYAVVQLAPSWGLVSIAVALFSLPLRFWARNMPWHPSHYWHSPGTMLSLILGLALVGLIFGGLGLRQPRGRGLSKVGIFLNATVAGVLALFAITMIVYFRFLR